MNPEYEELQAYRARLILINDVLDGGDCSENFEYSIVGDFCNTLSSLVHLQMTACEVEMTEALI